MSDSRGTVWSRALMPDARDATAMPSVLVLDGTIAAQPWRILAVRPNPEARFARARGGELGLDEALALADALHAAPADAAILAVVDTPGQPYGLREESAGLHVAFGSAVEAAIARRSAGGPLFALVVGKAISGAFLTHGLQAGWIGALDDPGIEVHVMSAASVARITRETPAEVARVAAIVPATARDIRTFARSGAVDALFAVRDPLAPDADELARVRTALASARNAGAGLRPPLARLAADGAQTTRAAALRVRAHIAEQWNA